MHKLFDKKFLAIFIALHLIYLTFWGWMKADLYVDEYWTYGLANNVGAINMQIEDGREYTGTAPFDRYMTVEEGEAFYYANVWAQQAADVHPPLYYVIIHTICSFFPGVFSKWFGLIPNYACLVAIDLLLYQIGRCIYKSRALALIAVIVNGVGVMAMNMMIFIRMYALLTAITMAAVLLFIKYLDKEKDIGFWLGLFLIAIAGTMTQYYFLILLFFLCLFQGLVLLFRHKWKEIFCFFVTLAMAGITSVMIFPAMLEQIFGSGYRGQEARANLLNLHTLAGSIIEYTGLITKELFGGHIVGVLFFLVIGIVIFSHRDFLTELWRKTALDEFMVLFMTLGYLVVIIKIAPFRVDRYVMCIGWCMVLLCLDLLYRIFCYFRTEWSYQKKCFLCFLIFMALNVSSMAFLGWKLPYAYVEKREQLAALSPYLDGSAIYVCENEDDYIITTNYMDLPLFKSYCYMRADGFSESIRKRDDDTVVLYIGENVDADIILQEAMGEGGWDTFHSLGKYGRANVYYLSNQLDE